MKKTDCSHYECCEDHNVSTTDPDVSKVRLLFLTLCACSYHICRLLSLLSYSSFCILQETLNTSCESEVLRQEALIAEKEKAGEQNESKEENVDVEEFDCREYIEMVTEKNRAKQANRHLPIRFIVLIIKFLNVIYQVLSFLFMF